MKPEENTQRFLFPILLRHTLNQLFSLYSLTLNIFTNQPKWHQWHWIAMNDEYKIVFYSS